MAISVQNGAVITPPQAQATNNAVAGANTAADFIGANNSLYNAGYQNQANNIAAQLGFLGQGLGLSQGYINQSYGLQSQNLAQTLQNALGQNSLQQLAQQSQLQGLNAQGRTVERNLDYNRQQINNASAARGAIVNGGVRQQQFQLGASALDALADIQRRTYQLNLGRIGTMSSADELRQQNLYQQAMMGLNKNYQLSQGQLGFNQNVSGLGFQNTQNAINAFLAASQNAWSTMGQAPYFGG